MARFQYGHLAPKQIRILTLFPGERGHALVGHLKTVQLHPDGENEPFYEALSYVRGDQSNADSVTLTTRVSSQGGSHESTASVQLWSLAQLSIGLNLAIALRHIRHPSQHRNIWCDAICINQEDPAEVTSQITFMGDIYTTAQRVVIWLGPEANGSRLAIITLLDTVIHLNFRGESTLRTTFFPPEDIPERRLHRGDMPISSEQWHAIADLLARPWFRRVWTQQEFGVAGDKAIIQVGDDWMLRIEFLVALSIIRIRSNYPDPGSSDPAALRQSLELEVRLRRSRGVADMGEALRLTRGCDCTDDRDRVYGLLGFIKPGKGNEIRPDYTQEVKEVYREMAVKTIDHSGQLTVLDFCDTAKQPTWVPDLDNMNNPQGGFDYACASGQSKADARALEGGRLQVYGVRCDEIATKIVDCSEDPTDDELRQIARKVLFQCLGPEINQWDHKKLEALMPGLLAGQLTSLSTAPKLPHYTHAASVFKQWARSGRVNKKFEIDEVDVFICLRNFAPRRSFCQTTAGDLLPGPAHAMPGDAVYTLLGCRNVMVLRPAASGEFQVVGPAYHQRFARSEALCGNPPEGWGLLLNTNKKWRGITFSRYGDSLKWQFRDLRLDDIALPEGWEEGEAEDGSPRWRKGGSWAEATLYDPRLGPEELTRRGVKVEEVVLC